MNADLNEAGTAPSDKDPLNKYVRNGASSSAHFFNGLVGRMSAEHCLTACQVACGRLQLWMSNVKCWMLDVTWRTFTCVKLRPTFNIWHSTLQKPIPRDVKIKCKKYWTTAINLRVDAIVPSISDAIFLLPVTRTSSPNVHSLRQWRIQCTSLRVDNKLRKRYYFSTNINLRA